MSQRVYWFPLARIPKSITSRIRQCIFPFLWGSTDHKRMMHLVDWHTISRPYEYGWWNINTLEWFSISLRLKSLWTVLKGSGLWNKVIQEKYLKNIPIDGWLR